MYQLEKTTHFVKRADILIKSNFALRNKLAKALKYLQSDPFQPSLKSHKTSTRLFGHKWSSSVSGDIRIIWDFSDQNTIIILLLDIGSHSGKHQVYN